ncbi:bifunctional folylpolyglutamate synthase/dihydrofolate synthase [hot springs metagenome]|uniref:Bifunctional folylpolyglutamate synthase/dihydrofolate synthase n=1 Tax=hot springs metagenome TaxID=433727 RepID=A0A5J4KWD8_9ZZZZ
MSYYDAINYLYSLQKYGIKLGIEKTKTILSQLGNPHKDFSSIHIAGTNGKGSVSAMIASILAAHGFKVGLFTSPHLVSFTERIKINNHQISESDVVSLTEEIKERILDQQEGTTAILRYCDTAPTFFEFVTAMAFLYFSRNNVDWAVIETGMGGRLDATNIIIPKVSVITKIGYDHKEFLGETLTAIASEKAGIIKSEIPVVSAYQEKEAEDVIIKVAKEKSSPFFIYGKDFSGKLKSSDIKGITFDYLDNSHIITDLHTPLAGEHQLFNACVAVKATMTALQRTPLHIDLLKDGLAATEWHGRLEIVSKEPLIMIDGAHNPDAAKALSEFIKKYLNDYKIILIIGIMSDKDMQGIMSPLLPLASKIIFTAPNYGRAASPENLAGIALQMGFSSMVANSVKEAIDMAKELVNRQGLSIKSQTMTEVRSQSIMHNVQLILITGSFYTIGEALEILGEKATLGSLRETV